MKPLIPSLLLLIPCVAFGQTAVSSLVLNPREIVVVPVAPDRLSTVSFPSPISHLEAAYVSLDAEPPSRFQLSFQPGNSFFSVRALGNARASINVRWNGNTYVFELVPSTQPLLALTLVEPAPAEVLPLAQAPTPHRLLGMLDTAKSYALLRSQHPAQVSDIQYSPRNDRYDFGGYEMKLEEVFRFQTEDTMVLRVTLTNKCGVALHYLPQSFRVMVGKRIFYAAIADGEGVISPWASVPIYLAVSTAPDGSRPGLAIQNDFMVLVTVTLPIGGAATPPAASRHPTGTVLPSKFTRGTGRI